MGNKENLDKTKKCNCKNQEDYEVTLQEEKVKEDPSKPCDPTNPDYPWTSCGIDKKPAKNEK